VGLPGTVLLGTGDFEYAPELGKAITGHQHAVMFRFSPDEQEGCKGSFLVSDVLRVRQVRPRPWFLNRPIG